MWNGKRMNGMWLDLHMENAYLDSTPTSLKLKSTALKILSQVAE